MDARYRRGAPGVRDAFSEAFGVKKQAFPVPKGNSVQKKGSLVYGVQFIQKSAAPEAALFGA